HPIHIFYPLTLHDALPICMSAWKSLPGYDGWRVHLDQLFVPVPESVFADSNFKLPVWICTAHYYLSDITKDLCPTYIIPGRAKRSEEHTSELQSHLNLVCR